MSKTLVFSGPFEDHHKSFAITSKSLSYVNYIFEMSDWDDLGDDYIQELDDDFLTKVEKEIGKLVDSKEDLITYFTNLSKDKSISLEKYSNMIINILPNRRGSWCSYIWVKGDK